MIVKEYFYNVLCDCCEREFASPDQWVVDEALAKERADESGFKKLGGKHYCPDCYSFDDDDNIVTKDGRKFDGDTYEEIKEDAK